MKGCQKKNDTICGLAKKKKTRILINIVDILRIHIYIDFSNIKLVMYFNSKMLNNGQFNSQVLKSTFASLILLNCFNVSTRVVVQVNQKFKTIGSINM